MVNITSGRNIQAVLLKLYKQCWNSTMKVITQIYLISLKYHSNECCVSYLAISMIMATLASCDQVIFKISLYVLFQCVCVCFVKLETEFREIIHSWQINEITCLNERIFFSYTLFICHIFSFQHKLYQSTNRTYNYHGNGNTVGRNVCSNPDESFGYIMIVMM